jgi:hypothetical protein
MVFSIRFNLGASRATKAGDADKKDKYDESKIIRLKSGGDKGKRKNVRGMIRVYVYSKIILL